jgi:hypothetical protein
MKAYVVITFLIPESASKVPELFVAEGWAVRRCGTRLVETRDATIGGISVFEVDAKDIPETGALRDRVRILLDGAEILYFSLFVGPTGGAGWCAGNVPLSKEEPAQPSPITPLEALPTAWQRLDNSEL